jgi:uncharacterized sulfatase
MTQRRRDFLASGAALAASSLACQTREPAPVPQPPNVLVIYTDEHARWTLGAYGDKQIGTPNIDRIGREGATFHNYFVNSAVCTPSRGCFITGRYPHSHGAYRNDVELNRDEVTMAHMFEQQGYDTAMAGKWHLDGTPRPGWMTPARSMGFADCKWMYNRGHWKRIVERPEGWPDNRSVAVVGKNPVIPDEPDGMPDIDYNVNAEGEFFTDWLADKAIDFMTQDRQRPFFYYLSIPDPHGPDSVRAPYDTMFQPEDMPIPNTFYQENLPDWAETARLNQLKSDRANSVRDPRREQKLRRILTQYFGAVKCIDDSIGRILKALEAKGILDNTLVMFTSDHGDYLGEHGLYNKNQLYEPAHQVAMLLRWPEKIAAGTVVDECVGSVDVQPTLLKLLGLETSGREQGFDASALLTGDASGWKNETWIHHSSLKRAGIFTPEWQFALVDGGDPILFDRRNDPDQVTNLAADPARKPLVGELTTRIIDHNREVESPALGWLQG